MSKSNKTSMKKESVNNSDSKFKKNRGNKGKMNTCKPKFDNSDAVKGNSKDYASHAYNDMSWYTHNPVLLESACRIPFAYPCGGRIDAGEVFESDGTKPVKVNQRVASAGVVGLHYVPSIGNTDDGLSAPINIAAREMYAKIRKAYSGSLICDAPDIMLYMLSLDGIFSYLAYLKRIYRLLDIYSGTNKYVVEGIFSAMGYSPAQVRALRQEKTRLWGIINTFVSDANKWSCPAKFDILNRHYWMNDNIYLDKINSKAQMYVFNPVGFYTFGLDNDSKGQVTVESPDGGDVQALEAFGHKLLDALSSSEDAYTINGYLARAFEGTPNFRVSELGIGDKQEFVYAEEVLNQIHNATIVSVSPTKCTVTQDGITGVLKASYEGSATVNPTGTKGLACSSMQLFDSNMEVPDAVNIVVGSRLHATVEAAISGNVVNYRVNGGTEIIVSMSVLRINPPSMYDKNPFYIGEYDQNFMSVVPGTADLRYLAMLSQFDWAPLMVVAEWDDNNKESGTFEIFGDVTNLTTVSNNTMDNLHRMCIYSEFNAFGIDV